MTDEEFAKLIDPIARELYGDPNKHLSNDKTLAYGTNGSLKVNIDQGTWFDFEQESGGGAIDLVKFHFGIEKAAALEWLEEQSFIPARTENAKPSQPTKGQAPQEDGKLTLVCAYDYHDSDGNPLYQVTRWQWKLGDGSWKIDHKTGNPAKTFRQRRKDSAGNTVYNLDGIGHTIYRHPQVEIGISESQTVYLVEGEKDAETLVSWGLCATTNSGGAKLWNEIHASYFKGADVVIIVDNDDAGREGGQKRARSLKGIAQRVRVLDLAEHIENFSNKLDITDWKERFGGTAEKLQSMLLAVRDWTPEPPKSSFRAVGLADLGRDDLKHDFLVHNFLDQTGVAMMPGESGSGKTFLTLHVGMCVATGRQFFNLDTKSGLVIYQAGEGAQGAAKRIEAWLQENDIPNEERARIPFRMLPKRVNLFVDDKDTDAIIKESRELADYFGQPVRMVIFDTFNKMITGANENAGQDMGKVLARMERISEELNCLVMSPIHKNKQGQLRGHTSLIGDASNVLNVSSLQVRDANNRTVHSVVVDKNKDGDRGAILRFVLRQVVLGQDDKGRPMTSCVVEKPDGATEEQLSKAGRLSRDCSIALQILRDAIIAEGVSPPLEINDVPNNRDVIEYRQWIAAMRSKWFFQTDETDLDARASELQKLMTRVGKVLFSAGYIGKAAIGPESSRKSYVWWTGKDDRVFKPPAPAQSTVPKSVLDETDNGKVLF